MSNQRPFSEENLDQAQFNYQKYLPQNYNPSSYLPTFKDESKQSLQTLQTQPQIDTQITAHFQNRLTSLPPDSFRSTQPNHLDTKLGMNTPQFYGYQNLQSQQQVRNPLDNLQNTYNKFQEGTGGYSQLDSAYSSMQFKSNDNFSKPLNEQIHPLSQPPNFVNQQQQQLLMLELLKANPQLLTSGSQSTPMFGAGFLNAAQLLASQQASSQSHLVSQNQNDYPSNPIKPNNHGIPDQSMVFLQELNKLYTHVNHYQNQIDQIERKSTSTPIHNIQNVPFQNNPPSIRNYNPQIQSQYPQGYSSTVSEQFRSQKYQQKGDDEVNQSINQSQYHFDFPESSKINANIGGNNNVFNYESKLRPTSQFQNQLNLEKPFIEQPSLRQSKNLSRFEDQQIIQELSRQSPIKNQRRDSPGNNSSFRGGQDTQLGNLNDSLVKFSNKNSPIKQKQIQIQIFRHSYQNSVTNQILQEQQMNSLNYNNQAVNKSISIHNKSAYSGNGDEENNQSYNQQWAKNNQKVVNIDDIPITSKAKTFEELLERNLKESGQEVSIQQQPQRNRAEKKEFLKKKSKKPGVPQGPSKKYNYYIENFEEVKKTQQENEFQPQKPEPKVHDSSVRGGSQQKSYNSNQNTASLQNQQNDNQNSKSKKPFLSRGTGTAGGKGLEKSAPRKSSAQKAEAMQRQNTDQGPQKQSSLNQKRYNNTHSDMDQEESNNEQDTISPNRFDQRLPQTRQRVKNDITRSSIVEFEKLEKECNNKFSPDTQNYKQANKELNKKKKKLFDSDSDEEEEQNINYYDQSINKQNENEHQEKKYQIEEKQVQNEEVPKSDVVRKFFYKQDPKATQQQQKKVQQKNGQQNPNQNLISEEMEKMIQEKVDQLNQAIESVNSEKERVEKQKKEIDQIKRKLKEELRDVEGRKKKELEDFEKFKSDEIEKLKKEKKQLENRQKNIQQVNTSNKRERDEIDFLKKELQKAQEESKAKDSKNKSTIERLKKQVDELTARNKELQDEIKHIDTIRANQNQQQVSQKPQKIENNSKLQQPSNVNSSNRYTFSTAEQELNNKKQQIPPIKGILKNKNESPTKPQQTYYDDTEDQHLEDEYVDEADDPNYEQQNQQNQQIQQDHQQEEEKETSGENVEGEDDEDDYDIKYPHQYHSKEGQNMKVIEHVIGNDGKIQRVYENGKKEVIFNNGVKREVFPDGYTIVYFNNNDIKQTYPDQKVVYYFAEAKTTQTTFPDGLQVFKFANQQIEKHFPDGTKEIIFPDGTIKCIFADGEEESIFPDGTIQRIEKNGIKAIEFANGQKDILFPDGTRIREYPDGRIRKQYPDGTYETSYRQ